MRFAYYPGCNSETVTKENLIATKKIAERLGIQLIEFREFSCCGAAHLNEKNPKFNLAVNARNFALAERHGLNILTTCSTCLYAMHKAKYVLDNDEKSRKEINEQLRIFGLKYKGKIEITHLAWVLNRKEVLKKLKEKIKNPVKLRIAPFYGCHSIRPSKYLGFDNPKNPLSLENLIKAVGGAPVGYSSRLKCCGFHTLLTNRYASERMNGSNIKDAIEAKAELIVTACPLCYVQLKLFQDESLRLAECKKRIPVMHLSQLIGLALGFSKEELEREL